MGDNTYGQLEYGISTNRPEMIDSSSVVAVATGSQHSLFIKSDGILLSMGTDEFGQLGDAEDNYDYINHDPLFVAPQYPESTSVIAVAAGFSDSFFIMSDGSLWGVGDNEVAELGIGGGGRDQWTDTPVMIVASNVVAVAAGLDHSLFIKSDGSLWGMGYNGTVSWAPATTWTIIRRSRSCRRRRKFPSFRTGQV